MLNVVLVSLSSTIKTVVHPIYLRTLSFNYPVKIEIKLCEHAGEREQSDSVTKKRQSELECHLDNLPGSNCKVFNNELCLLYRYFEDCIDYLRIAKELGLLEVAE